MTDHYDECETCVPDLLPPLPHNDPRVSTSHYDLGTHQ